MGNPQFADRFGRNRVFFPPSQLTGKPRTRRRVRGPSILDKRGRTLQRGEADVGGDSRRTSTRRPVGCGQKCHGMQVIRSGVT